jgi:hypothetical protein
MRVQFGCIIVPMGIVAFRMDVKKRTRHQSDQNGNDPQQGGSGSNKQAAILYRRRGFPVLY